MAFFIRLGSPWVYLTQAEAPSTVAPQGNSSEASTFTDGCAYKPRHTSPVAPSEGLGLFLIPTVQAQGVRPASGTSVSSPILPTKKGA